MPKNINALIVPTGIGASIGGYAGDANPVAKLLANVSDYLITHPNVVNGAVMTKIPENVLVVEGYLLDQFFLDKIALRPKIKHKIGIVVDSDIEQEQKEITENCLNAARYFYGLDCLDIVYSQEAVGVTLESKTTERQTKFTDYEISNPQTLLAACQESIAQGATALAIVCKIPDPPESEASLNYIQGQGYDPIGLIEAQISHLVAQEFMIPCAHAPILDPAIVTIKTKNNEKSIKINNDYGVVHPRVSAEYLGLTFLPSVLQCLNHSAKIIPLEKHPQTSKFIGAVHKENKDAGQNYNSAIDIRISDLANLVVPYNSCNGIPMHEASKHGIHLLTVKQNQTNLNQTAKSLGLEHKVLENYLEAAGYLVANKKSNDFVNPELFIRNKQAQACYQA